MERGTDDRLRCDPVWHAADKGSLVVHAPLRQLSSLVLAAGVLVACGGHRVEPRAVEFAGIRGYLVDPGTTGRHPAVVLVHGSGGDRRELLPQARALARQGMVALTITEPSSSQPLPAARTLAQLLRQTRTTQERDIAAVRAAAAFLVARGDVDGSRLGYLGWSAGAKTGTFVVDRFRALALLSAGAAPVEAFVQAAPPASRAEVRRALTPIDPIRSVAHARADSLLLEDGRQDQVVPRAALLDIVHAAPPGTTVRWYETGHSLDDGAYRDARDWLAARLR